MSQKYKHQEPIDESMLQTRLQGSNKLVNPTQSSKSNFKGNRTNSPFEQNPPNQIMLQVPKRGNKTLDNLGNYISDNLEEIDESFYQMSVVGSDPPQKFDISDYELSSPEYIAKHYMPHFLFCSFQKYLDNNLDLLELIHDSFEINSIESSMYEIHYINRSGNHSFYINRIINNYIFYFLVYIYYDDDDYKRIVKLKKYLDDLGISKVEVNYDNGTKIDLIERFPWNVYKIERNFTNVNEDYSGDQVNSLIDKDELGSGYTDDDNNNTSNYLDKNGLGYNQNIDNIKNIINNCIKKLKNCEFTENIYQMYLSHILTTLTSKNNKTEFSIKDMKNCLNNFLDNNNNNIDNKVQNYLKQVKNNISNLKSKAKKYTFYESDDDY
jgi:hypothetical protein